MPHKIDPREVQQIAHPVIDVRIGDVGLVEPQGVGERFKTAFIGWERGRFVIMRLPTKIEQREHLYAGKRVIVRYLSCSGDVSGFESEIQGVNYKPQHLFFIDYPDKVEIFSLRKENRVDCFLPASLTVKGEEGDLRLAANILNISKGGCRIGLNKGALMGYVFEVDQHFLCEFYMLGQREAPNSFMGQVRTVGEEGERLYLGVEFEDVSDSLQQQIDEYVRSVGEYLGGTCAPRL